MYTINALFFYIYFFILILFFNFATAMRTLIFAKIAKIFLSLLNYERITQSLVRDVIIQLRNSSFVQQRSTKYEMNTEKSK